MRRQETPNKTLQRTPVSRAAELGRQPDCTLLLRWFSPDLSDYLPYSSHTEVDAARDLGRTQSTAVQPENLASSVAPEASRARYVYVAGAVLLDLMQ